MQTLAHICQCLSIPSSRNIVSREFSLSSLRRIKKSYYLFICRCPNKNTTFLTKHKTIACSSIAKILVDSKRVCINLDFDTLGSLICKISFGIRKFKDINVFSKSRFQAILRISVVPTSLRSSPLNCHK